MADSVAIVIPTFGDFEIWEELAKRAYLSAETQVCQPDEIIRIHGRSLAEARNQGAEEASAKRVIFLDADDMLDPRYTKAMLAVDADVRQPATLGFYPDGSEDDYPVTIPKRDLLTGNYLIIGTCVERERFLRLGGFSDFYPIWEDWECWLKFYVDGASFCTVPEAVYKVYVRPDSRNAGHPQAGEVYREIRDRYTAIAKERGLIA